MGPCLGISLSKHTSCNRVSERGLLGWGEDKGKGVREEQEARERAVPGVHFKGCICPITDGGKAPGDW